MSLEKISIIYVSKIKIGVKMNLILNTIVNTIISTIIIKNSRKTPDFSRGDIRLNILFQDFLI